MTRERGRHRSRSGGAVRGRAVVLAALMLAPVALGCGAAGDGADGSPQGSLRSEALTTTTTVPDLVAANGADPAEPPPILQEPPEIPGIGTSGPAAYPLAELDPSYAAPPVPLLAFDEGAAYRLDEAGFTVLTSGPIHELATDGAGGILFQRQRQDPRIWWLPLGAPSAQELLVTEVADSYLILEGVTGSGDDRQVVYQRVIDGGSDVAGATLRTFGFASRDVTEVAVTGSSEHDTRISSVAGGWAAGTWSSAEASGYYLFDLDAGQAILGPENPGSAAPVEQHDLIAIGDDELIGVGSPPSSGERSRLADRLVVYRLDQTGAVVETIAELSRNSGSWYPSDVFVANETLVISRAASPDGQGGPSRGPVVVDLATSQTATLPFTASARPAGAA